MSSPTANHELAGTVRFLVRSFELTGARRASAELVIASLRDLGLDEEADQLESLVVRVRAERAIRSG